MSFVIPTTGFLQLYFAIFKIPIKVQDQFKLLLDAFHGSYKDKYYSWVAVNIILRSWFFALYGFTAQLRLLIATITLIIFANFHGYIHPNKNKLVNIQELLLLLNLTILYAVSYYCGGYFLSLATNIMFSLVFFQFLIIVLYHFLTYTCNYDVVAALHQLRENPMKPFGNKPSDNNLNNFVLLDTDEDNDN